MRDSSFSMYVKWQVVHDWSFSMRDLWQIINDSWQVMSALRLFMHAKRHPINEPEADIGAKWLCTHENHVGLWTKSKPLQSKSRY
jgi:hypothetical protein